MKRPATRALGTLLSPSTDLRQGRVRSASCCDLCEGHRAAARVAEGQVQRAALVVVVVSRAVDCHRLRAISATASSRTQ
jgi:hypothetical protein